ncbi:cytochrome c maturation protein CcmE [Sphingomonas koreensis]|uniref:Cytochrome c-type biogenesis protein CcmE n=1 Tax=Sphingomonas koreensis TaxID=93064 RepID=A0A1L6JBY8_9SPHN|nr:cytochrome c maturation protein CcmE [Sphingomonas koreensis]APR53438.1 cytochrome c biogenesis protein CcmE [Sphingomonas koreensis]MDC7809870.1 cytochrome c maturation protein CcmE [Sphingomonas koreensis]RSU24437.1 cytochrome c maturation protein CcmE [Sphingomonas koreensis]RSU25082.1 cytochrome c maturation protein CcmE [Sphingomonas koreensis]RSU30243.1 cytochrome c maturation protein CcmE [Sphingomonas koreensis]
MKRKHQRLALGLAAFAAIGGASGLALSALKDQAAFFYTPSDVATKNPPVDKAVRLGGMVETGSIRHLPDGVTISFVVTDKEAKVPVRFTGVAPDLFKEGSGVVAEGRFTADGGFVADNLLAKHDERYMPPEIADKMPPPETLAK